MWRRLLFRAAIKGCGIVVVPVNEINGAVRLLRESNVADEWPGRKLTFHRGLDAPAFQLGIETPQMAPAEGDGDPVSGQLLVRSVAVALHRPR